LPVRWDPLRLGVSEYWRSKFAAVTLHHTLTRDKCPLTNLARLHVCEAKGGYRRKKILVLVDAVIVRCVYNVARKNVGSKTIGKVEFYRKVVEQSELPTVCDLGSTIVVEYFNYVFELPIV